MFEGTLKDSRRYTTQWCLIISTLFSYWFVMALTWTHKLEQWNWHVSPAVSASLVSIANLWQLQWCCTIWLATQAQWLIWPTTTPCRRGGCAWVKWTSRISFCHLSSRRGCVHTRSKRACKNHYDMSFIESLTVGPIAEWKIWKIWNRCWRSRWRTRMSF